MTAVCKQEMIRACERGGMKALAILLNYGANLFATTSVSHVHVLMPCINNVKLLLCVQSGKRISQKFAACWTSGDESTLLKRLQHLRFVAAIDAGHLAGLRRLVEAEGIVINQVTTLLICHSICHC